ncbi:hypothetical protein HF325_005618 [Metschnikowia pulcherrima]|uniref:Uncharacterized protein n=1 Tax=Metschnikowia pulcherrima TaxID=27326 RepID=A0A8H7GLS3_9ASCO|nr:hypothetical protein HF325_005618 [Metschnikowia pulcherrima]
MQAIPTVPSSNILFADVTPGTGGYINQKQAQKFATDYLQDIPGCPEAPQELLDWLIRRLQLFLRESYFDSKGFESLAATLENQLHEIGRWILQLPFCQRLAKELEFAEDMFRVMANAVEELGHFKGPGMDEYLVRCVIQLNVRLLAFHDSQGEVDLRVLWRPGEVRLYETFLRTWSKYYKNLPRVPVDTSLMFESQFTQAQNTLRALSKQIEIEESSDSIGDNGADQG